MTANPFISGRIIKLDCPISEYLASKGDDKQAILSRSDLMEILNCPSKWRKGARPDDRRTWQSDFGSLVDCLLTQPKRFGEYYKIPPETYTNSKGATADWTWRSSTCRDWRDEQEDAGFLVCTAEEYDEAKNAIFSIGKEYGDQLVRLIENSQKQVFCVAEYHDEATGIIVFVKTLTDLVPAANDVEFGKTLFDLKTARSAHPKAWKKSVFEDNLHVQAAMGLDCYCASTGELRNDFRHLIVENEPPYEPARRFLSSEFIGLGREKYVQALKLYCQCVKAGYWPSYKDETELTLPDGYECVSPEAWMIA